MVIISQVAAISMLVVVVNHRRSPLVQEGPEIPVEVSIVMPISAMNKQVLKIYIALISDHYE